MKLTWLFLPTFLTTVIVVAENSAQEATGSADALRRAGNPQETSRLGFPATAPALSATLSAAVR